MLQHYNLLSSDRPNVGSVIVTHTYLMSYLIDINPKLKQYIINNKISIISIEVFNLQKSSTVSFWSRNIPNDVKISLSLRNSFF